MPSAEHFEFQPGTVVGTAVAAAAVGFVQFAAGIAVGQHFAELPSPKNHKI